MKHRIMVAGAALAAVAGLVTPGTASAAARAAARNSPGDWIRVYQARGADGFFKGIAAISKNNTWAVGNLFGKQNGKDVELIQQFIRHYDGTGWKAVTIPGAQFAADTVAASAANNVWIFGYIPNLNYHTAVYRYDGSRWHKIPVPQATYLDSAVVFGPSNVWAVGGDDNNFDDVFHWNGAKWQGYTVRIGFPSLSASGANNIWLAGRTWNEKPLGNAVAYRWTGTRWAPVAMPHPAATDANVKAFSPTDVWIGWNTPTTESAMHWNGHHWHVISLNGPGVPGFVSTDIVPDGRGGDWFGPFARWTGRSWIGPYNISPASAFGSIDEVARIPGTSSFWLDAGTANFASDTEHPTIYRINLT